MFELVKELEKKESPEMAFTREYFNKRFNCHLDELKRKASAGKHAVAQNAYIRLRELSNIAVELNCITVLEQIELFDKVQNEFYDSL